MIVISMKSELTNIRKMEQARAVLASLREQGKAITFEVSETKRAQFKPKPNNEWNVWETDEELGVDLIFQPALVTDEEYAVRRLWELRKHYNAYWRD